MTKTEVTISELMHLLKSWGCFIYLTPQEVEKICEAMWEIPRRANEDLICQLETTNGGAWITEYVTDIAFNLLESLGCLDDLTGTEIDRIYQTMRSIPEIVKQDLLQD